MSWSLDLGSLTTQVPACGYKEEFTVDFAPKLRGQDSFVWTVSESAIDFKIYSEDLDDETKLTVTLLSTLVFKSLDGSETALAAKSKFIVTLIAPS